MTTISPGKLDLFVVTLIDGRRAHIDAVMDYDAAVARAEAFHRDHPCQMKVLPLTGEEARNLFGISLPDRPQPVDAEMRQQFVATLTEIVRDSNDGDARREALDVLDEMGAQS